MRTNVRKGSTKQTDKIMGRWTSIISLVSNANRRDTIQIYAQRKVHQDFSELGQLLHATNTRRRHTKVYPIWKQLSSATTCNKCCKDL
jgi:hypothetical protein